MPLLRFHPLYQTQVWGGRRLAERLGRTLPGNEPIGESWEIIHRTQAQSVDLASGKALRELLLADSEGIMGPGYEPERYTPPINHDRYPKPATRTAICSLKSGHPE